MKLSPYVPRSISLSAQLLVTFVALVAATATGLTFFAYQSSIDSLVTAASRDARVAAETRDQLLTQLLESRLRRANGFLASLESICADPVDRGLAWADGCVEPMLSEFRGTEQAMGALLNYRDRELQAAGEPVAAVVPEPGRLAVVVGDGDGVTYVTRADRGDTALTLAFGDHDVRPLFYDRAGLGVSGEVLMLDGNGRALTQAQDGTPSVDLAAAATQCRTGPAADTNAVDSRGRRMIAEFRRLSALSDACIVAYRPYDEALGPAASMGLNLITQGVTFVLWGVLLSLVAARRIAAPVKRLAESARALQAGHFGEPVPVAGPSEVRDLGRAFGAMATDLAELVSREQAARREAEAANRSKDQFLAMLSHELRTPLNAVLGWAHTLRTGQIESDKVHRAAAAIERSAESQRRLIEDLLDVTGIAAGRVRMVRVATSLATIVESAVDAVNPRADAKGVRIDTAIEDAGLVVFADSQRLQQVVWNLLWNAVKFTPSGGDVHVRVRASGGLGELTVTDNGIGIEPEFLPHVFGWFRRADRGLRTADEGLGLGLALVRQLVELHGGSVRAESDGRDRGSTFVVLLPLHQEQATPAADGLLEGAGVPDTLASVRVLVVDDDSGSREAVRVLLEQVGAQVDTVGSAAEARRHLRAAVTDVLISDIAMAQESGYTLMETLRAEGLTLPGIALTGYARREDADRAYAAGFDVHLPKPVDPAVLVSVLVAITKRRPHDV